MINKLFQFYTKECQWFRMRILTLFLIMLLIFIATSIISYIYNVNRPDRVESKYNEIVNKHFANLNINPVQWKFALSIFVNNLKVTLFSIVLGLIPLLFIPLVRLIQTSLILGLIISYAQLNIENAFIKAALGILPHGLFEIPAVIYSFSLGIIICIGMSRELLSKFRFFPWKIKGTKPFNSCNETLSSLIAHCFKSWLLVVVPLLLVAAIIEGFLSPLLINIYI